MPDVGRRTGAPRPAAMLRLPEGTRLSGQLFAGVTLAALALPLNIGYAQAAGLPASVGISASMLPLLVYAVASGSRQLVTGPDATIAALLAATLPTVAASSGADATELALGVALLTGAILILLWALRAGSFVRFISKSVLVGFLAGLGIDILTSQVEKMLNLHVDTGAWLTDVAEIVQKIPDASLASVAVGVATILIVRICGRLLPSVPGPLVALVIVGGLVAATDPGGVATLGDVPAGLPPLSLPTIGLGAWADLASTALAIAVLTIAEGLLVAGAAARRHRDDFAPNAELLPFGVANVAAGLTSGMPVGASASRTAALDSAGMRSQVPAAAAAVLIALVALFFTDVIALIPQAALAGLVANAVVAIIDVGALREFARVRRSELVIALGCTAAVLALGPIGGLVLATLATAVDLVRRVATLPWATLQPPPDAWDRARFTADTGAAPSGIVFLRLSGPLFFANADVLRQQVATAVDQADVGWVVLDFEAVTDVDPTASEALHDSIALVRDAGKVLALTRLAGPVRQLLDRYRLLTEIGSDRCYQSNREALAAYQHTQGSAA
jgi:MFS superfamily sulfate permease-like transporter